MSKFLAIIIFVSFSVSAAEEKKKVCLKDNNNDKADCTGKNTVCKWVASADPYKGAECVAEDKKEYPCVVKVKTKITECYTKAKESKPEAQDITDTCKKPTTVECAAKPKKPTGKAAVGKLHPLIFIVGLGLTHVMAPFLART